MQCVTTNLKHRDWQRLRKLLAKGTEQKTNFDTTIWNRFDVNPWKSWGRANRVKLGTWLLECIMASSGWFEKIQIQIGSKRQHVIAPTPEFLDIKEKVMRDAELFAPLAYPMLIEPNDWE